ncbi:hypothetical protein HDU90_000968, partial [Geranomyces variabilis]
MSTTTTPVSTATQQQTQAVLTPATPAQESRRSASVGATPSPAVAPPETLQSSRPWARDRSEATRLDSDINRILAASNIRARTLTGEGLRIFRDRATGYLNNVQAEAR